jgi:hypothetical protein
MISLARPAIPIAFEGPHFPYCARNICKHLDDPDVLVVDSPELVRRQAVPMPSNAKSKKGARK